MNAKWQQTTVRSDCCHPAGVPHTLFQLQDHHFCEETGFQDYYGQSLKLHEQVASNFSTCLMILWSCCWWGQDTFPWFSFYWFFLIHLVNPGAICRSGPFPTFTVFISLVPLQSLWTIIPHSKKILNMHSSPRTIINPLLRHFAIQYWVLEFLLFLVAPIFQHQFYMA